MVESTSCGLNGGPLKGTGTYPAYIACVLHHAGMFGLRTRWTDPRSPRMVRTTSRRSRGTGSDIETESAAPKAYISKMKNGSIAGFRYFDLTESTHIAVTVRGAGGVLELLSGEKDPVIASIPLAGTADWTTAGVKFDAGRLRWRAGAPWILPAVFPV